MPPAIRVALSICGIVFIATAVGVALIWLVQTYVRNRRELREARLRFREAQRRIEVINRLHSLTPRFRSLSEVVAEREARDRAAVERLLHEIEPGRSSDT